MGFLVSFLVVAFLCAAFSIVLPAAEAILNKTIVKDGVLKKILITFNLMGEGFFK